MAGLTMAAVALVVGAVAGAWVHAMWGARIAWTRTEQPTPAAPKAHGVHIERADNVQINNNAQGLQVTGTAAPHELIKRQLAPAQPRELTP